MVNNDNAVASITTTVPRPDEVPPPSSFINARPSGGYAAAVTTVPLSPQTWHDFKLQQVQPLVAVGGAVEEYDNQQELGVRGEIARQAMATKALSLANNNHQCPPSSLRNTHSSDRGRSSGGGSNSFAPLSNCCYPRPCRIHCHIGRRMIEATEEVEYDVTPPSAAASGEE